MKQTVQEKKKHELMDSESVFLIKLIQTLRDSESYMDAIEYLEKYDECIQAAGHILERLGLAEFDERRLIADSDLFRPGILTRSQPAFRDESGHRSDLKPAT